MSDSVTRQKAGRISRLTSHRRVTGDHDLVLPRNRLSELGMPQVGLDDTRLDELQAVEEAGDLPGAVRAVNMPPLLTGGSATSVSSWTC